MKSSQSLVTCRCPLHLELFVGADSFAGIARRAADADCTFPQIRVENLGDLVDLIQVAHCDRPS